MFDYLKGEKTASDLEGIICKNIDNAISRVLTDDFADVYNQYPWKNLADFVVREFGTVQQIMGNGMKQKIQNRIGKAGFVVFSNKTNQSQNAIKIAKTIDSRLERTDLYFKNYAMYVEQITKGKVEKAQFTGQEVALFAGKVQQRLNKLKADYQSDKNRVNAEINDNYFLCPLLRIVDIWYLCGIEALETILKDLSSKFGPEAMKLIGGEAEKMR